MAVREKCSCNCNGENHGKLRQRLDSTNPTVQAQAKVDLENLRLEQKKLQKEKSSIRRHIRTARRKSAILNLQEVDADAND
jgi:hypothetical protein